MILYNNVAVQNGIGPQTAFSEPDAGQLPNNKRSGEVDTMVRKTVTEVKQNLRGGKGEVEFRHVLSAEELNGHGSMYAQVILKPGNSIGWHQHVGNTEPYFILEGHGIFVDNDGSRTEIGPGDVCCIEVGQSHAIENNSDRDLVFMALIYNA
jgi:mannose-6-phosphate isomerase-like protein (cupin superfamily)